jgi:hypothetical protein
MGAAPDDHAAGHHYAPAGDAGTVVLERVGADRTGLARAGSAASGRCPT